MSKKIYNPELAPLHPQEAERIQALKTYGLMGTAPELYLDEIVELVAEICGSTTALLTLVGEDKLWFKSRYNYNMESAPRDGSFCSHVILHDDVMIIEDTTLDERFCTNPLVTCAEDYVRFYAGVPLLTENGLPIGVLCAIDSQPRTMTPLQMRTLRILAKQIMAQLDLHKSMISLNNKNQKILLLNDNKDKFLAIIAHDLKAAFHGLMGFSEVLDTEFDELSIESSRKIASYLNETSHSTYKLLEGLLEWAMFENGSMSYRSQQVDLERLVDGVVSGLQLNAEQKNIQLEQNIHKNIMVKADINMLKSLLHNLISNAIKFSNAGEKIKVYEQIIDDRIEVAVEDNGIGMSQLQLYNLFKSDLTQTTRGTKGEAGTGLGLLLCQQFAQQLGGNLEVQSKAGEGSTFKFSLAVIREP